MTPIPGTRFSVTYFNDLKRSRRGTFEGTFLRFGGEGKYRRLVFAKGHEFVVVPERYIETLEAR